ncbi:MAG: hypothetical protein LBS31_04070 [Candidatus Adiutrix sp.]|jgi:chromosomal replication initiator protein|nr:hypothetical protein [Candidatus Adiutrix sp.]
MNARRSFGRFLISDSNRLAALAVMDVAERESLTGLTGLFLAAAGPWGKSLILEALAAALAARAVPFIKMEAGRFLELFRARADMEPLRRLADWRVARVVILDDIHLLGESRPAQDFFIQIFDEILADKRRLVVSAPLPPRALTDLSEPLRSRLGGGLILKIDPPEHELLADLAARRAAELGCEFAPETMTSVLRETRGDPRQLFGLLESLAFIADRGHMPVEEAFRKVCPEKGPAAEQRRITVDEVISGVAAAFALKTSDLIGHSKSRQAAWPRRVAMLLAREMTALTTTEIGAALGGRDHSTVIHALKKIKTELKTPTRLKLVENIRRSIVIDSGA